MLYIENEYGVRAPATNVEFGGVTARAYLVNKADVRHFGPGRRAKIGYQADRFVTAPVVKCADGVVFFGPSPRCP